MRSGDISPDETKIAGGTYSTGNYSPDIIVWDISAGGILTSCSGHTDQISCVDWSPDGTKLASTSRDATVRRWNASTGALIRTINASASYTRHVEWSPDGTMVVSGSRFENDKYKGYIEVWNASTGSNIRSWYENGEFYWCCWSPDGTKVAGGGREDNVYTYNVNTGSKIRTFSGHTADVYSCDWSHDGTKIASCSADNSVRIWDESSGNQVLQVDGVPDVRCVAWSYNDDMVGSTKANSMVFIIDSGNGDILRNTYENGCGTNALVWFSNDNFATFGDDGTARIFGTKQLIKGDFEPDGDVDLYDFAVLALAWLSSSGDGNWNPACDISDPNDSVIDELDLEVLSENWLEGTD